MGVEQRDDLGLSIDMLDADRLREWARLLLVHGSDISHWASVPHVAGKLQVTATSIEHAVRDIGTLLAALTAAQTAQARAERQAELACKARDAYDEERRDSYQQMCGWKGRAEKAEQERDQLRAEVERLKAIADEGRKNLASAIQKMLPPELLREVIEHLDPLTPFVAFLRKSAGTPEGGGVDG